MLTWEKETFLKFSADQIRELRLQNRIPHPRNIPKLYFFPLAKLPKNYFKKILKIRYE